MPNFIYFICKSMQDTLRRRKNWHFISSTEMRCLLSFLEQDVSDGRTQRKLSHEQSYRHWCRMFVMHLGHLLCTHHENKLLKCLKVLSHRDLLSIARAIREQCCVTAAETDGDRLWRKLDSIGMLYVTGESTASKNGEHTIRKSNAFWTALWMSLMEQAHPKT